MDVYEGGKQPSDRHDNESPATSSPETIKDGFQKEILTAQQDAVLLLSFVSERKERTFQIGGTEQFKDCGGWSVKELLRVLGRSPEDIRTSPKDWAILLAAVDHLADLARPATVESIRFTRRYVEGTSQDSPPTIGSGRRDTMVRWLRRLYLALGISGLLTILMLLLVLYHVVNGQMILQKLEGIRAEQMENYQLLAQAFSEQNGAPISCRTVPDGQVLNQIQQGLCDRGREIVRKMDLTYLQLEAWNLTADCFYLIPNLLRPSVETLMAKEAEARIRKENSGAQPVSSGATANADVSTTKAAAMAIDLTTDWNRTELRAESMLAGLSNYGIPTLLGFIGATVFVFRRLSTHLEEWTLDGRERFLLGLRPLLGMMLGGLVSLVFDARGTEMGELKFSLGFLAFLAGYSVQYIFDMLDGFIMRDLRSNANRPTTLPAAPFVPSIASKPGS